MDSRPVDIANSESFSMSPVNPSRSNGNSSGNNDVHNMFTQSRPKRPLTAFETYVRFEMMLGPDLWKNESQLSIEESEFHWQQWTGLPNWKKQVYQDLATADEIRYKKELQAWQNNGGASVSLLSSSSRPSASTTSTATVTPSYADFFE